ncbi:MAG: DUF6056 family protein [Bacteroides sp.]|nr:DUF6056 family protein [Bacteroides sp.]MCM1390642.1 DUF6056 family protein [Bacteroides sp.]
MGLLKRLPVLLVLFIGIIYIWLSLNIVLLGDDVGFYLNYEGQRDYWFSLPRSMYRHWLCSNGRMADMLTPIWLNILPHWANVACNGLMTGGMFWMMIRLSSLNNRISVGMQVLMIFLIAFTFRWDALWMEFITQYNYVYSATLMLSCLCILFCDNKREGRISQKVWNGIRWAVIPLGFISGAMHEASGFPVSVGLFCYLMVRKNRHALTRSQCWLAASMILGGLFPLTSRAVYVRVGSMLQPEPPLEMLLTSGGYVLLLAILIVGCLICGRKSAGVSSRLRSLCYSPWMVLTIAAFVSVAFMFLSRYGGRTGWFAQIYALVAIVIFLREYGIDFSPRASSVPGVVLSVFVVGHYVLVGIWQHRLAAETREVISLYRASQDGVIFYDYHNEPQLPQYQTLLKTHGVPDDDDTYYRYRMKQYYGKGEPLTILPTASKTVLDNMSTEDSVEYAFFSRYSTEGKSHPDYILRTHALAGERGDSLVAIVTRRVVEVEGRDYIRNDFRYNSRQFIMYSLMDRDRGEK